MFRVLTTFASGNALWICSASESSLFVNRLGGTHHGYFMPSEGDSDEAFALFTFPSLAEYEVYRNASKTDPECQEAFEFARTTGCIRRYERRFLTPMFD